MNGLAAGLLAAGSGYLKGRAQASDAATEQARYDDTQARYADQQQRQQRQDAMSQDMQAAQLGVMRDTAARNKISDDNTQAATSADYYDRGFRSQPSVQALGDSMTAPGAATTAGWDGTDMASTLHGMAQMGADLQQQARGPAAFTRGGVDYIKSAPTLAEEMAQRGQDQRDRTAGAMGFPTGTSQAALDAMVKDRQIGKPDKRQVVNGQIVNLDEGTASPIEGYIAPPDPLALIAARGIQGDRRADQRDLSMYKTNANRLGTDYRAKTSLISKEVPAVRAMADELSKPGPLTDVALKDAFIKAISPGQAVSKFQFDAVVGSMGLPDRARLALTRMGKSPQSLTDDVRNEMLSFVKARVESGRALQAPLQRNLGQELHDMGEGLPSVNVAHDSATRAPDLYSGVTLPEKIGARGAGSRPPQPSAPPSPLTPKKPLDSFWVKQP